jgi:hypothetical protein
MRALPVRELAGESEAYGFPDKIQMKLRRGEMAEWLKARASKACIPLRVSGVRIPLSPPCSLSCGKGRPRRLENTPKVRVFRDCSRQTGLHGRRGIKYLQYSDFSPEGTFAVGLRAFLRPIDAGNEMTKSRLAICGKIQQNVLLPHLSAVVCLAPSRWKR